MGDLRWNKIIVDALELFPNAVMESFLREYELPVSGSRPYLINRIITAANGGLAPPNIETLMHYLDDQMLNGYQHIFLFRLKKKKRDYLKDLMKEEYIKKQLENAGYLDRYNRNVLVRTSRDPELVEVKHLVNSEESELVFKWVETRYWGRPPQRIAERSVNFFRVDLKQGKAELRIQRLQHYPRKSLRKERDIYLEEIAQIIDFQYFLPVCLEPVISRLLKRKFFIGVRLSKRKWEVMLPHGGHLSGRRDPKLFIKLGLPYRYFWGRNIRCGWSYKNFDWGPSCVLTDLRSESGEVTVTRACDKKQMSGILANLRKISKKERIGMWELKKFSREKPHLFPVLVSLDGHFRKLEERKISEKQLWEIEWFQKERVHEVFKELPHRYPGVFSVSGKEGHQVLHYELRHKLWFFKEWIRRIKESFSSAGTKVSQPATGSH